MDIAQLVTASPADIDTRIVALAYEMDGLADEIRRQRAIASYEYGERLEQAEIALVGLRTKLAIAEAENYHLEAEYTRRGGWSRVWLVPGGHAHRSRSCHSLYVDTVTVLCPRDIRKRALSGASEEKIVDAAGDRACTHCYPSAPVEPRPSSLRLESEEEQDKARRAREEAKAKRTADKAAKAITSPDGSRLRFNGWIVATEIEAQRRYVEAHADAINNTWGLGPERHTEKTAEAEALIVAIAAKRGETVDEARERLAPKIADKARRDARAMAAAAKRIGLE